MAAPDGVESEYRVLVLAPTGRDAANSVSILSKAGINGTACRDIAELCRELGAGAGTIILTEEALGQDPEGCLATALHSQPTWSDLPIILLTRGGPESTAAISAMRTLGNIILLERPVRVFTLVTATQTALRARSKQYQIRSQLEELKKADARKDEFLATLAHELRNPLAPIRTGLQIFRASGELTGPAAKTRDMMERQIGHMVRLIDDLMDISRITRGKIQLKKELLDFRQILDAALETSRPLLEAAKHEFTISLPRDPLPLEGDQTRLAQVLNNLLNNAAKYTPDGGKVNLSAAIKGEQVVVRVRDTGVGIPADMLPKVFDMFTQVGRSIDRAKGGLGIGLTLVQRLVEMHGGTIAAESQGPGQGSTFVVTLPLAKRPHGPAPAVPSEVSSANGHGLGVLVVDDNADAATSLAMMLEIAGYETRIANSGPAALDTARSFHPAVVFLDIGMPGMNGFEVARRFRADSKLRGTILVALTGWGNDDDKRQSREAGFDFHLTKPADAAEIEKVFADVAAGYGRSRRGN